MEKNREIVLTIGLAKDGSIWYTVYTLCTAYQLQYKLNRPEREFGAGLRK